MISAETLITVTVVSTLGMLSPGPDFFLVIKNAVRYPRKAAMMTVCGINCAIAVHMTYCIAGLALVITTTPWLFNLLKYAGAAYLAWIGIQALRSHGDRLINSMDSATREIVSHKSAFLQGFLCNLLNPKATLFFLSAFTVYLGADSTLIDKSIIGFIILILAVIYWPILVLAVQHPAVMRVLHRIQGPIDKVLGVVLLALSIKVAFL